jgi:hypothetical protein
MNGIPYQAAVCGEPCAPPEEKINGILEECIKIAKEARGTAERIDGSLFCPPPNEAKEPQDGRPPSTLVYAEQLRSTLITLRGRLNTTASRIG